MANLIDYDIIKMIIALLLINLYFTETVGYWRYFGLIGFGMVGWYWKNNIYDKQHSRGCRSLWH